MNIKEIINSDKKVQIVINAIDLKEAFLQWVSENQCNSQKKEESYLTTQETAKKLGVDKSTLWRWNKTGYLNKIKLGNKPYYRVSDINKLMEG